MHKKKKISNDKNKLPLFNSKLESAQKIHQYYLKIISYMPNNVYWLDRNCITQGCNNNILKLLNLKKLEDFVGINYSQMAELAGWTEGQAQSFENDDREVMETGIGKFNVEEPPLYNKEGEPVYYVSSRVPIFDDKGKEVIGVVGISVDITERKKNEQKLKEEKQRSEAANQAKTEFLANMRHDIRTPLSGIVGCAQIIQSQANNAKKVSEFAEDLIQSSDALLEFLNKVLESIKVASGEIPLLKKKFDLQHALKLVIQLNESKAAEKGLLLSLDYDKSIPAYVIGDPIRVQRIILELITNAIKFTQQGEVKLTVKLMKHESRQLVVKIMVSDTGIGIPIDKQQDLYTRFKRFVPSYEGIYSGVGLGLSIIKQFLDDLQAEIYLESQPKQ
ncbi:MAG: PAS domain-containing protein, partial [Gammaproteobacteria bacterium]